MAGRPIVKIVAVVVFIVLGITGRPGQTNAGLNVWTTGGPPDEWILTVALNPLAPKIVYAGSNGDGVFRSLDGGNTWATVNRGLTNPIVPALAVNPHDTAVVYAGTTGDGIFRSLDGGTTWTPVNTGLTNPLVTAIALNSLMPSTVYAGTNGGGVFRSLDGGDTWAAVNAGLANTIVSALVVNPVTPNVVYAATPGAGIVFRSANGGTNWSAASTGLSNPNISSLAIDPLSPNTLYAGTIGNGVFKTVNAGGNWTATALVPNAVVTGLAVNPLIPNTVYASTIGGGVFRTTDAGDSWAQFNTGLGNFDVRALAITPSGACVHAATKGTGVFDFALVQEACTIALAASVLPSSRSVVVSANATAFATIINPRTVTATSCGIGLLGTPPATLSFQTTNPTTNVVTGAPNTPVDIPPGQLQTYVIGLTPLAPFAPTEVGFNFSCTNTASAPVIIGVNTLLLGASNTQAPDIVALATADAGIVNIPGPTGTGVFAVATINMGAGANITASADTGGVPLPVTLSICETNPNTSQCLAAPTASVARTINPGETPTYGIFVSGQLPVFFNPAVNRIFVRFKDDLGITRGSTSVAVRTQ